MKIVFDLDGVLRDLCGYLHSEYQVPYPKEWDWSYRDGDMFDWIQKDNYRTLRNAPPLPYLDVVKEHYDKPEIWTCQPAVWKPHTEVWIRENIGDCTVHYLTNNEKRERLDQEKDTILVEDSPKFSSYKMILLIEHPYNRHVTAFRIFDADHLSNLIQRFKQDKRGMK